MGIERVKEYLKKWGKDKDILEMKESTATVEMAAQALGVEPKRIAKTLSLQENDGAMVIVAAGDAKIDNSKFKEEFSFKVKLLTKEEAIKYTGYEVGGICPFDLPENVNIYLDESLKRFSTVFPACGSGNSAIELKIKELEEYSNYKKWIDVCKNWKE